MLGILSELLRKIGLKKRVKSDYFLYKGRDKRLKDSGLKKED
jgi:hypothetical protein